MGWEKVSYLERCEREVPQEVNLLTFNNKMKDIGMASYEKQVEQEAAYPIPISLYNCYRTVRHEKCYQEYIKKSKKCVNISISLLFCSLCRWKCTSGEWLHGKVG